MIVWLQVISAPAPSRAAQNGQEITEEEANERKGSPGQEEDHSQEEDHGQEEDPGLEEYPHQEEDSQQEKDPRQEKNPGLE